MYSCKEMYYIGLLSSCIITGSIRTEKANVFTERRRGRFLGCSANRCDELKQWV